MQDNDITIIIYNNQILDADDNSIGISYVVTSDVYLSRKLMNLSY